MKKIQIHKVIFTIILYGIGFTMLTPLLWMISTSFKPENEVFQFPIRWIPEHSVGFDNYKEVWGEQYNFGMYYLNSIKVTVISTVLQILVSALGAYGFTKIKWKGRDQLFLIYLATMMIPSQAIIIANYLTIADWGIRNTYAALILPNAAAAFAVFNMRQAFLTLPKEIHEAAEIDGCTNFKFLYTIGVPLIKPSLGALIIYVFLQSWNYYLWPLLVTDSVNMRTVQIGLGMLQGAEATDFRPVMAGAMVILIPSILVFIIGQKQMISGLTAGAVKG